MYCSIFDVLSYYTFYQKNESKKSTVALSLYAKGVIYTLTHIAKICVDVHNSHPSNKSSHINPISSFTQTKRYYYTFYQVANSI
jgi:hypothetical protein